MDIPYDPGAGFMSGSGITGSGQVFDWPHADAYWHGEFLNRDYVLGDRGYAFYQPAFRYGSEAAGEYGAKEFDEIELHLKSGWEKYPHWGEKAGNWDDVRPAVRDAWEWARRHHGGRGPTGNGSP